MDFPILYKKINDKIKFWKISVQSINPDKAAIFSEYGFVGGKITKHSPQFISKSIGKKTPYDRAIKLAQTKWINKMITDKYTKQIITELPEFQPMKPTDHEKASKSISFPAYIQPKLDGVRMFSFLDNGKLKLLSRTSKPIENVQHLIPELNKIFKNHPDIVLDGELLIDPEYHQKDLRGLLKKIYLDKSDKNKLNTITYNIFDVISRKNMDETFHNRWKLAKKLQSKNIKIVPTITIKSQKEIDDKFNQLITSGFEGAIIRNKNGKYRMGRHSNDVQKIKLYFTEDFIISNFHEGTGNDAGTVIWEVKCQIHPDKTFRVRPKGSREIKKELFKNAHKYIGKKLRVHFYEKDHDGCVTRIKTADEKPH